MKSLTNHYDKQSFYQATPLTKETIIKAIIWLHGKNKGETEPVRVDVEQSFYQAIPLTKETLINAIIWLHGKNKGETEPSELMLIQ